MSLIEHEVEIRTGRRDGDMHIRLSIFAEDMLALTVEGHGERAPTILLSLEQAHRLQSALAKLLAFVKEPEREESNVTDWDGEERRRLAS